VSSPTITWEIAQALGLSAVAGCLVLCMLAVRPRAGASSGFSLRAHELVGWLALGGALLHAALSIGVDHQVVEHLKPTAPRYEYAGIVALLALLFLTVPSGAAARSRLWLSHRNFQAGHVATACLLIVMLAIHVLTTGRYVDGRAQTAAYLLLSGIALLALLRPRGQRQPGPHPPSALSRLVFGRHSKLVLAFILGSLLALLPLFAARTTVALREPFAARSERLPLDFPHDKHRSVSCVQCHHDYVDRSGQGSCVACHRSARADLQVGVEARFHDFCLSCHRDPPATLVGHGPVTGCATCHAPLRTAALPPGL
jgi:predicted CXXCH cytochrome family protein